MINKRGFTLIELLVVATIMVLLASSAAVAYSQFGRQSRDAKRRADLEQIRTAVEIYRSNLNEYPPSISFGGDLCDPAGCSTGIYLKSISNDPKAPYIYHYTRISANDYTIGAYLEGSNNTCGVSVACGSVNCNYCLGPYGQK